MPQTTTGITVKSTVIPKGYKPSPNHRTTHVWNPYVQWRLYILRIGLREKKPKVVQINKWLLNKLKAV